MNLEALRKKLLAAARSNPPSDAVPYAFEKRILARLTARPAEDPGLLWGRALWRGAMACVAVSLLLSAWSLFSAPDNSRADLEETMIASATQMVDSW